MVYFNFLSSTHLSNGEEVYFWDMGAYVREWEMVGYYSSYGLFRTPELCPCKEWNYGEGVYFWDMGQNERR